MAAIPDPLTPGQQATAEKLYRRFVALRKLGVRMVLVSLDVPMGLRVVGQRETIAPETGDAKE